jgi:hypothetical protein
MVAGVRALLVAAITLAGCRSAHEVADESYRSATAPVNVGTQSSVDSGAPVTTTTTTRVTEGSQVSTFTEANPPVSSPKPTRTESTVSTSRPVAPPPPRPVETNFPTAKPVDGKPGYVYSPSDPTKYVDVSGYAPGSKVKDPYSGKIFLVP